KIFAIMARENFAPRLPPRLLPRFIVQGGAASNRLGAASASARGKNIGNHGARNFAPRLSPRSIYCSGWGGLATGVARTLPLGFAKHGVGEVIPLKVGQLAHRFALFLTVGLVVMGAHSCNELRQFRFGQRRFLSRLIAQYPIQVQLFYE